MSGPRVRTDLIDLYVVRRASGAGYELLQLRRTREPMRGTWQPVMGHIENDETAIDAVVREAHEEIGLDVRDGSLVEGPWQLEQVHPYFIAAMDCVVMSPRFVVLVRGVLEPRLSEEHDAHRWVNADRAKQAFTWPGQHAAIDEVLALLSPGSPSREHLRVRP